MFILKSLSEIIEKIGLNEIIKDKENNYLVVLGDDIIEGKDYYLGQPCSSLKEAKAFAIKLNSQKVNIELEEMF